MKYLRLHLLFAVTALASIPLTQCNRAEHEFAEIESEGDVTFAKETFEDLARGNSEVIDKIDWLMLDSMGENVGLEYARFVSESEKRQFETAFVTQFAAGFQRAGGTPSQFTNWRVSYHDDIKTEVAADSGGGTVTIKVTERDGKERISGIGFID